MKFIIEHLENEVYEWCLIEYENMSKVVGKENLIFTKTSSSKLKKFGKVENKSVLDLNLKRACLLDPKAKKTLSPQDFLKELSISSYYI